jgi:hypothetical protein
MRWFGLAFSGSLKVTGLSGLDIQEPGSNQSSSDLYRWSLGWPLIHGDPGSEWR